MYAISRTNGVLSVSSAVKKYTKDIGFFTTLNDRAKTDVLNEGPRWEVNSKMDLFYSFRYCKNLYLSCAYMQSFVIPPRYWMILS